MGDDDQVLEYKPEDLTITLDGTLQANFQTLAIAPLDYREVWASEESISYRPVKPKVAVTQVFLGGRHKAVELVKLLKKLYKDKESEFIWINNPVNNKITWSDLTDLLEAYKYVTLVWCYDKMAVVFGKVWIEFKGIGESLIEKLGDKNFATIIDWR